MADKEKSAELILKLYELRREEVMRQARTWFATAFHPEAAEDFANVVRGEHSGHYRMVTSYWDMACSLVNHGAIDEEMFNDANGEQVFVFARIQPFLEQIRATGNPQYMLHLEKAVMRMPGVEQRLAHVREIAKMLAASARPTADVPPAGTDAANA